MPTDSIHVIAEIRLLATEAGGRESPIRGSYQPNHRFFDGPDAEMAIGALEIPDGVAVRPSETIILPIAFLWWPALSGQIYPGREWRIHEGRMLVGFGRVIEVLGGGVPSISREASATARPAQTPD